MEKWLGDYGVNIIVILLERGVDWGILVKGVQFKIDIFVAKVLSKCI